MLLQVELYSFVSWSLVKNVNLSDLYYSYDFVINFV